MILEYLFEYFHQNLAPQDTPQRIILTWSIYLGGDIFMKISFIFWRTSESFLFPSSGCFPLGL
jgi:hypothetical protein